MMINIYILKETQINLKILKFEHVYDIQTFRLFNGVVIMA